MTNLPFLSSFPNRIRHSFLDPFNTMQRSDLPLTVHEYDEFGNPADPLTLKNILSYSPCENIKNHSYPAMFVSTGDMDQKVGPWESLKWVTRVREMQKMRRLQFDQLSDMQSQPSSPLGPWSESGSGSESIMENDRKVIDQDLGSLSRMDSNGIRHDINIDIESASIPPDSHIDPHSPPTLPFVHSVDGDKEAIEGKTGGGGGGNQYSERLIVFSMTPNAGHDGSSDPTQMMYLQAAEIVFLENAIKKNP